jgi:hypothetical protein
MTGHFLLLSLIAGGVLFAEPVDFQRDVRPILSDACYHCHGPDKDSRMVACGSIRPRTRWPRARTAPPLCRAMPRKSLIWQRINHKSPVLRMPPVAAHKVLSGRAETD